MMMPPNVEAYGHKPWTSSTPPKKILVIRFHAFGDVVITLPYLQVLKNIFPAVEFHLLTREECADIPRHAVMFEKVYGLEDRRDTARLIAAAVALSPRLVRERYDIVLDLQRNTVSRFIRRVLSPASYSEFDRYSPRSAGERVRRTIDALRIAALPEELPTIALRPTPIDDRKWYSAGYTRGEKYSIVNPAGSSDTKNWPITHYERFIELWEQTMTDKAHVMLIGTGRLAEKVRYLKKRFGGRIIDLVDATSATEALHLVRNAQFVLSEDSGLMHLAWISRVPLVALFGSTPCDWSKPLGTTSVCLDSSDLECGNCGQPQCRFGDVHCLVRWTPEFVVETARRLLRTQVTSDRRGI
jgi:heptosyltransferase II